MRLVAYISDNPTLFKRVTLDALKWIEKHDTRRFQRVQKHLRGIVANSLEGYASYNPGYSTCNVNIAKFAPDWSNLEPEHYEWYLTKYASTIVHEATHGYLKSLGFAYLQDNQEQIERICHSEQIRFISRVQSEYYDYAADMVWPFDASLWHEYWSQTYWGYYRSQWSKWRERHDTPTISPSVDVTNHSA